MLALRTVDTASALDCQKRSASQLARNLVRVLPLEDTVDLWAGKLTFVHCPEVTCDVAGHVVECFAQQLFSGELDIGEN